MNATASNPLQDFSGLPLFDQIQPAHVAPAIQALLADANTALETVTALCTSDPRPITPVKTAGEPFAEADKAALDRDLAVVPTKPAPQLGLARVTIQVTP